MRGIYVPELEQEANRNLSRLRSTFWKSRQQVGAHLKSLLFTQGLIEGDDKTRGSQNWLMDNLLEIQEKGYPSDFLYTVRAYKEEWEHLIKKIKEIEKHLKIQAESEKAIHQIYTSVPGIGLIHGRELCT